MKLTVCFSMRWIWGIAPLKMRNFLGIFNPKEGLAGRMGIPDALGWWGVYHPHTHPGWGFFQGRPHPSESSGDCRGI